MKPDWKEKIANAPESFRKRNPHLYLDRLGNSKPEHREIQTLASGPSSQAACEESLERRRITIVRYGSRALDSDNFIGGCKPLRDAIALEMGFQDDSDERLEWCYLQIDNSKVHGTHVLIQNL